jgi:hypothetical protein
MKQHTLITIMLYCLGGIAQAQNYYSQQDTADLNRALQVQPTEVQLSAADKAATNDSIKKAAYMLQRLKDVLAVKKDVLYGGEITPLVRQLQDSNFVLAQPIVSVHGKGIFIGLINQVGSLFEGNNTEPWLKLNSEIVPQQAKSIPFTLDAKLTGSAKIQTTWLTIAETKMDSVYKNKKYLKIDDALADLETANAVALAYLQKAIGKTLAPPFLLKVNNTKYWGGVKIPLWQKTGTDSTHLIDFVTRNGQNPNGDITWACSTLVNTNYDQAWVNVKKPGTSTLTVTYQDNLTQTFTLNVTSSDAKAIVEDFLKTLAKEVIADIISSGIDDITKNYASLDSVVSSMGTLNEEITTDLNEIDFDVSQGQNEDLEIIYLDNEQFLNTTTKLTDAKINNVSLYMLKYELSQMLIKRKALITLLVNKALFEPDEFEDLITDLKNNFIVTIGGFTAEMIVNGLQPAAKAKIKDSLKVYLNKIFDDAAKKLE